VHGTFQRCDIMLEVVALTPKLAQCARDGRISTSLYERAHGPLHLLGLGLAGNRAWHREQRRVAPRDALLVCNADLELDARVFVEVVQAREDRLECGDGEEVGGGRWGG
jgi:hypothetical protein